MDDKIRKKIVFIFLYVLLLLVVIETSLRLFYPQPVFKHDVVEASPQIFVQSDYLPFQLKPNAIATHLSVVGEFNVSNNINSFGYRDYEFNLNKDYNIQRMLFLGDSFTFGFGVELNDTYVKVLERLLNQQSNVRYQLINAGYKSGRSPDTEYLYLKKEGMKLEPDAIFLGFFIGNDFGDYKSNTYEYDEADRITKIRSKVYYIDSDNRERRIVNAKNNLYDANVFLSFHLHLYILFKNSFRNILQQIYSGRPEVSVYSEKYSEDVWTDVNITLDYLLMMKRKTGNIPFYVIVIPSREQVYNYKIRDISGNYLNWTKPNQILLDFGRKNNIIMIDLLPYFTNYAAFNDTKLYFNVDPHWNSDGHKLAADIIYSAITN